MENAFIAFMLLLFVLYTLLLLLRQRKARQEIAEARQDLTVGDRVMMTSGIIGVIRRLGDETLDLEIAPGVITQWHREAVREAAPNDDAPQIEQVPDSAATAPSGSTDSLEHTEKERDSQ